MCRAKTEEARITSWQNLQKAKAEAEIRKLEVFFSHNFFFSLSIKTLAKRVSASLIESNNFQINIYSQVKLEKKRSSSMARIMRKVKSAEKKAEEMRRSVLDNQAPSASRGKALSFRRSGKKKIASLSGCFTCHAF